MAQVLKVPQVLKVSTGGITNLHLYYRFAGAELHERPQYS
jgi:hypothetical protein